MPKTMQDGYDEAMAAMLKGRDPGQLETVLFRGKAPTTAYQLGAERAIDTFRANQAELADVA